MKMRPLVPILLLLSLACGENREPPTGGGPAVESPSPATPPKRAVRPRVGRPAEPAHSSPPPRAVAAVLRSLSVGKPMLIDWTGDHCLACRIMAPWIVELREKYKNRIEVVELNADRTPHRHLVRYYDIRIIPTQLYLDAQGTVHHRHAGLASLKEMDRQLAKLLPPGQRAEAKGKRKKLQ